MMLLLPKKTKKDKQTCEDGGWKWVFVTPSDCIRYLTSQEPMQHLQPTCSPPRARGEETFGHIEWTDVGKVSVTHTDKLPRHRQNAGKCKSRCFICYSFPTGIRIEALFAVDVQRP